MFAAERRQLIIEMVRANGAVSLRELARVVQTSEVTVRRDVRALEAEGLLDRRHGGAVLPGGFSREPGYSQKPLIAPIEKSAIADLAADLVQEGDTIMVGTGSTTLEFARRLIRIPDLTVVTNSLSIAQALAHANRVEVVMTGGTLSLGNALVGSEAQQVLHELRASKVFLSGGGLTAERGLSTANMLCASVDRVMVQSAAKVIVLADHTKLGAQSMFQTVPTEAITRLVTDRHATVDDRTTSELDALADCGVQIDLAPVGPAVEPPIHDQATPVTQPRLVPLPSQRRSAHGPTRRR
ncbi:DeoR/GlpR family transcriptional regulator of sugar metabolism [Kitasatospora sp. MAA19]|uniref:DeoR/GlpR family DNA-binding transcription regulator n=1 Tax=Kitasatospora sp. MAA19 TaxID=3035090 RepID=UPI0024746E34|nr:DeoR/GlpR family DNA-binding transcription regulator [Kitasatospora sp. MAA19]MDH6705416.1 DeoR/GlpR family transcriptional regulator of sugar metabolism [Kitasatospora sp. MAA19]